jgi:hypothetical protein
MDAEELIRKSAVTLTPKAPFLEWLAEIAKDHPVARTVEQLLILRESVVWIIPSWGSFDSDTAFYAYLSELKPHLLTSELQSITLDRTRWPDVSTSCFDQLFDIQIHHHVFDIERQSYHKGLTKRSSRQS